MRPKRVSTSRQRGARQIEHDRPDLIDGGGVDALEVAIILHDVATPPFGHLFEYVLKEQLGWDHESAAVTTLLKDHGPGSSGQQIYAGRTPKVLDHIERLGVDMSRVKAVLTKKHELASLIFGVLDFDNIDNVWRMAWGLGCAEAISSVKDARALASSLDVDSAGSARFRGHVDGHLEKWARLRRFAYDVLIFDQPTVASQAVLTFAIKRGLQQGVISPEDWLLNDETFLLKLSAHPDLKELIQNQYLGRLPNALVAVQVDWGAGDLYDWSRESIESAVASILSPVMGSRVWVYAFKEKGSFEKEVRYSDDAGAVVTFGRTSRSLIISTFAERPATQIQIRHASRLVIDLLVAHGVEPGALKTTLVGNLEADPSAGQLPF